jgi:hypothetical protein
MTQTPYPYRKLGSKRYHFISVGKKRIEKVVEFIAIGGNIFNLAFGDLLPDGSIDDQAISNNGDIVKVLATVVDILKNFTSLDPGVRVYFLGSTPERTKLYSRILRTYYSIFSREFTITGISWRKDQFDATAFDPNTDWEYEDFLIKRIS